MYQNKIISDCVTHVLVSTYVHCILHHLITGKQDATWVSYTISVMDKIIMIVYICY